MSSSRTAAPATSGTTSASPRKIGTLSLILMIIAASAPLTVVAGGTTSNFAVTSVLGIPLSFVVLGIILALFAVGFAALSTKVQTAGAFYSYVARGLGRVPGVAAAWVAIVAYNAMQIGIYGMFGFATADLFASVFSITVPWWACAIGGWVIVGILGVNAVDLSAKVLGILVALEFLVVFVYDFIAIGTAPEGISAAGFAPGELFTGGVGAVLAFSVAAFMGFESGAIYTDEVRDPRNTVRRATFGAVIVIAVFYAFSAWAMVMGEGASNVVANSAENGPGVVFAMLGSALPVWAVQLGQVLFVTSLLAALVSFHNVVSRYLRSLAREGALPAFLATSRGVGQAPVAGSLTQSALAIVVLLIFAVAGAGAEDPIMFPVLTLFTWLTNVGALGLVALMALTSFAALVFLRRNPDGHGVFTRVVAPLIAGVALGILVVTIIIQFPVLVGLEPGNVLNWLLPLIALLPGVIGALWAMWLRGTSPERFARIGHGSAAEDAEGVGL